MFRRSIATIATVASLFLSAPAFAADAQDIVVAPGSQLPYSHSGPIRRIAIGDPAIAAVAITSSKSVLITGKQPGSTTLFVWENRHAAEPSFQARIVVSPVKEDGDLKVAGMGDRLQLTGTLSSLEQHQTVLQGLADEERKPVDASASSFDTQVQIDIKVVEVSRQRMMNAGFSFNKNNGSVLRSLSAPGNVSGVESNTATGGFTLLSQSAFLPFLKSFNVVYGAGQKGLLTVISVLEENGFAYTLAEPSLTAISGQTASFLAGGEIPIPLRTGGGADSSITIKFKEFGIRLALTPTVLDRDRIFLKVSPEVSELDETLSVQTGGVTVPGLRVRRTDTSIALGNGESFVLSGLISRNTTANVDKFPVLGDLPVLGAFFRSTRFDRADKELLMVVTAHLVRPFAKDQPLPPLPGEQYRNYDPSFPQLLFQEKGRFNFSTGFSD